MFGIPFFIKKFHADCIFWKKTNRSIGRIRKSRLPLSASAVHYIDFKMGTWWHWHRYVNGERHRPLPAASCRLQAALPIVWHGLVLPNTKCNCNDASMKNHILGSSCLFCHFISWFSLLLKLLFGAASHAEENEGNDWFKKPFFTRIKGWGLFAVVVSPSRL